MGSLQILKYLILKTVIFSTWSALEHPRAHRALYKLLVLQCQLYSNVTSMMAADQVDVSD